ncbi:RIP metalloprotease RseP [Hahella sp. CCB-MM4]|uniref:RIP metalloprotease RseP n=1 Tax=Hahella sp. (strain CCB-MM4) TaxID=1926491 RepID=UPI000B9A4459|nr:RIP metalloprotease RseP [Hahella sp. CCB-MM4]OZG70478.1 RIP metalloprotease RseP [Hahella sp. CCB-MM4]
MMIIQTILALIVTLGVLVSIHEFGHFWVARRCGVKVLRFSIGFGKPLYTWRDKRNTEFVVAALPLGGYVKMLDEREGDVSEAELPYAFNRQPVLSRIAIAAAGPIANFLFAILAYWFMFLLGTQTVVPVVGEVSPESVSQMAGLEPNNEIVAVDGVATASWADVNIQFLRRLGDSGEIELEVRSIDSGQENTYRLGIDQWLVGVVEPDPMKALGIEPFRPELLPIIDVVEPDSRAKAAGLLKGDQIISIDGKSIDDWYGFVDVIKSSPEKLLHVKVRRGEETVELLMTPASRELDEKVSGYIGAGPQIPKYPEHLLRTVQYGPLASVGEALNKTWDMTAMTLGSLKKMVMGLISIENLGGPITIAKVAGASASSGVESFLSFLAYLSISLGVLNLLPIPVLDGGHLLYYFVELVRGKPISEEKQLLGLKIGMAIIAFVMLFAFYNDLSRM